MSAALASRLVLGIPRDPLTEPLIWSDRDWLVWYSPFGVRLGRRADSVANLTEQVVERASRAWSLHRRTLVEQAKDRDAAALAG